MNGGEKCGLGFQLLAVNAKNPQVARANAFSESIFQSQNWCCVMHEQWNALMAVNGIWNAAQRSLAILFGTSSVVLSYVLSVGPALLCIAHIQSDLQFVLFHGAIRFYAPVIEIVSRSPDCIQAMFFDYMCVWGVNANEAGFFYLHAATVLK